MLVDGEEEIETNTKKKTLLPTHICLARLTQCQDRLTGCTHMHIRAARTLACKTRVMRSLYFICSGTSSSCSLLDVRHRAPPLPFHKQISLLLHGTHCVNRGFMLLMCFFLFVWAALICYFIHSFCARLPVPFVLLGTAAHQTTWSEEMSELS